MNRNLPKLMPFAALWLLAGCCYYTKAPWQVENDLDHHYEGRPVNEFFYDFGPPAGEFHRNYDGTVYRWVSTERPIPPEELQVSSCGTPYGHTQIVDTYNGVPRSHYCELRIYTDDADVIHRFAVAVDSMGKWSASRCSEIFRTR